MKKIALRDLAYARSGDKGDVCDIGVLAKNSASYSVLKEYLTAERVKEHFRGIVTGEVVRYELDNLESLEFVMFGALGGGATRTLAMDQTGKAFGCNLLRMTLQVED